MRSKKGWQELCKILVAVFVLVWVERAFRYIWKFWGFLSSRTQGHSPSQMNVDLNRFINSSQRLSSMIHWCFSHVLRVQVCSQQVFGCIYNLGHGIETKKINHVSVLCKKSSPHFWVTWCNLFWLNLYIPIGSMYAIYIYIYTYIWLIGLCI